MNVANPWWWAAGLALMLATGTADAQRDGKRGPSPIIAQAVPTVGVCTVADISGNNGPVSIIPNRSVESYQNRIEKLSNWGSPPANATVTVLVSPKHGSLSETSRKGEYSYTSTSGYTGLDRAIFLVDIGSRQFKVVYFIQVYMSNTGEEANCENDLWRISQSDTGPADASGDIRGQTTVIRNEGTNR